MADIIHTSPGWSITEEEFQQAFNEQAEKVETYLNKLVGSQDPCVICPTDGCIEIDLSDCSNYDVLVTENITCMRVVGEGAPGTINFVIPPNTTRRICGFPSSWGSEGNECDIELSGGDTGATFGVNHAGSAGGGASGSPGMGKPGIPNPGSPSGAGGGGGGGCVCVSDEGLLTVVCCSPNCYFDCTASDKKLEFRACGGKPPYTWSTTQGTIAVEGHSSSATLRPPTNSGSAVAGNAYRYSSHGWQGESANTCVCSCRLCIYGCDDLIETQNTTDDSLCEDGPPSHATSINGVVTNCEGANHCVTSVNPPLTCSCVANLVSLSHADVCTNRIGFIHLTDLRTAQMITDGCNPCGLVMGQAVVTVTDALDTSFSIVVSGSKT